MPHPQVTAEAIMARLGKDCEALVDTLCLAVGLAEHEDLRSLTLAASGLSANLPFAAALGGEYGWIEFGRGPAPRLLRAPPDAVATIDVAGLVARDDRLRKRFSTAAYRIAVGRLNFLFRPSPGPTRHEAAELDAWAPLIEKPAYRLASRSLQALDHGRAPLISRLQAGETPGAELLSYWAILETMARLTLLVSNPEAATWLANMAASFAWTRWTPTMPLLRERTCWLASCAARSAIAFGPSVISQYLEALGRSRHTMTSFDALFGLSAIALSAPAERLPIMHVIASMRKFVVANDTAAGALADYIFADCLAALQTPDAPHGQDMDAVARLLGWQRDNPHGLATGAARRTDPTDSLPSGRIIGFAMLPYVVQAPRGSFYAAGDGPAREPALRVAEIERLVRSAWLDPDQAEVVYH